VSAWATGEVAASYTSGPVRKMPGTPCRVESGNAHDRYVCWPLHVVGTGFAYSSFFPYDFQR
jgi:hypothetical protein